MKKARRLYISNKDSLENYPVLAPWSFRIPSFYLHFPPPQLESSQEIDLFGNSQLLNFFDCPFCKCWLMQNSYAEIAP